MKYAKGHFKVELTREGKAPEVVVDQPNLFTNLTKELAEGAAKAMVECNLAALVDYPAPHMLHLMNDETPASAANTIRDYSYVGASGVNFRGTPSVASDKAGILIPDECSIYNEPDGATTFKFTTSFAAGVATGTINKLRIMAVRGNLFTTDSPNAVSLPPDTIYNCSSVFNAPFFEGHYMASHGYFAKAHTPPEVPTTRSPAAITHNYTLYGDPDLKRILLCSNLQVSGLADLSEGTAITPYSTPVIASLDYGSDGWSMARVSDVTGDVYLAVHNSTSNRYYIQYFKRNGETYLEPVEADLPAAPSSSNKMTITVNKDGTLGILTCTSNTFSDYTYSVFNPATGSATVVVPKFTVDRTGFGTDTDYAAISGAMYDDSTKVLSVLSYGSSNTETFACLWGFDVTTGKPFVNGSMGGPNTSTNSTIKMLGNSTNSLSYRGNKPLTTNGWYTPHLDLENGVIISRARNSLFKTPLVILNHNVLSETNITPIEKGPNDAIKVIYTLTVKATKTTTTV